MPQFKVQIKVSTSNPPLEILTCSRLLSAPSILNLYRPLYEVLQSMTSIEDPPDAEPE
ncbi:hypothetical protein LCGC14_1410630 [marine sediment metagenome]|uniref:Uncharacterized protein n=1 Tax=marine sediment metagenome TaxID=412755 RepID=A0A0F9KFF3_9ZZZZ